MFLIVRWKRLTILITRKQPLQGKTLLESLPMSMLMEAVLFLPVNTFPSYLPHQWFQLRGLRGQTDAEGGSVWQAGDGAGKNGPSHGEGQHGVDHKHDEQEEGHLEMGQKNKTKRKMSATESLQKFIFYAFFLKYKMEWYKMKSNNYHSLHFHIQ